MAVLSYNTSCFYQIGAFWIGDFAITKNTISDEVQEDQLVTMEKLAELFQQHTTAQNDSNRRFTELVMEIEKNARDLESRLENKIKVCYAKMCATIDKKLSKRVDLFDDSPPSYRHQNYQVINSNSKPSRSGTPEDTGDRSQVIGGGDKLF